MASTNALDDRTPVIVGVGQVNQRVDRGEPGVEPTELMAEAIRRAADDAGDTRVISQLNALRCVHIFSWRYRDPAREVADKLGLDDVSTGYTSIGGNIPQMLVNQAAVDIANGDVDLVAVTGGEAVRTRQAHRRAETLPPWASQDDSVTPDQLAGSTEPLLMDAEISRGIAMPVQIYPLFESAWRAARGWSVAQDEQQVAELWSRFSHVAAQNPNAWVDQAFTPDELLSTDDGNRMIGFPYRKRLNSYESVDQGAAIIVASAGKARSLGLDPDSWVFPVSGTDGQDAQFVSNRVSMSESPAIRIAGRRALELAETNAEEVALVDLYSCFPSAVQIAAHELGFDTARELTVTGGLSFAGGPWSNYVTHSIATMVHRLRTVGGTGFVSANGGFLTKHSFGVYRTEPGPVPFVWDQPQDEIDACGTVELAENVQSSVTIESCTVMHGRDGSAERAIATTRLDDGRRAWAFSTDPDVMQSMTVDEWVGRRVGLGPDDIIVP